MKRQKRDLSSRTFNRGYHAGLSGKSQEQCPHQNGEQRHQWLSGWREGRADQWSGYTGVAGVHRAAMG